MVKLKKTVALCVIISFCLQIVVTSEMEHEVINFEYISLVLEPCEPVFSTTTLDDDFEDNTVVIVLNRTVSREERVFTVEDFNDVGAVYVGNVSYLSEQESYYVQKVWETERELAISERRIATSRNTIAEQARHEVFQEAYLEVREEAEYNTMVNFDEFRQTIFIRLNKNCKQNVLYVISQLQNRDYIYYVGVNYFLETESVFPNDHYFRLPTNNTNYQWSVRNINLPQAWGITTGSSAVRVGVVGNGIQAEHEELCGRTPNQSSRCRCGRIRALLCGSLVEERTGNINSATGIRSFGAGTQQAGIIGAMGNNGIGIAGIAWNVQLYSVGVFSTGSTNVIRHANGINNARHAGIPILTHSFGSNSTTLFNAVRDFNGLFVQSAGNSGANTNNNPRFQGLSNVLVVGSNSRSDSRRIDTSNYGTDSVHLFAPSNVRTISRNGGYTTYGGTSSAAPHVAGVAALLYSRYRQLRGRMPHPTIVRRAIMDGVDITPAFECYSISGGRLNAYGALRALERFINTDALMISETSIFANRMTIYNPTNRAMTMQGMNITNNRNNLFMWRSPALIINPGSAIVVAGANSTEPHLRNMRTNFDLERNLTVSLSNNSGAVLSDYRLRSFDWNGVYRIRNVGTGQFLDSWNTFEGTPRNIATGSRTVGVGGNINDQYQRWILQRVGNYYNLHSYVDARGSHNNQIPVAMANIINGGGAPFLVPGTASNGINRVHGRIRVVHNANNTVTFMWDSPNQALTITNGQVRWQAYTGASNQQWQLQPHHSTYRRGDVTRNGVINQTDINWVNEFINGTRQFTAMQFFLADINRDGRVDATDVNLIRNMI
ncbi:MAG: S8 family serine peptidase [Oscillospiraceae bacterium]|nr:S8 family serine peptidase [Oscillospiraceae bacterium]